MVSTNLLLGDPRIIHDAEKEKLKLQKETRILMKITEDDTLGFSSDNGGGAQLEKSSVLMPIQNDKLLPRGRSKHLNKGKYSTKKCVAFCKMKLEIWKYIPLAICPPLI